MSERVFSEWCLPSDGLGEQSMDLGVYAHGVPVVLDPRNTFLRIFDEGEASPYNQVVHFLPGLETPLVMPLNHENMQPFKGRLLNGGYPVYHQPEPDAPARRWLAMLRQQQQQEDATDI